MGTGLVLGFFDGVHLGHQAVIESAKHADDVVVLTFSESPAKSFNKDVRYILSRKNSQAKMEAFGATEIVLQDFNAIRNISAQDYLKLVVEKYNPETISTGFNYSFGLNKTGTKDLLKQYETVYGYKYLCTPPQMAGNDIISSTLIKQYLKDGDIKTANRLLGSNFILEGFVIKGEQLGRTIGFPTANFEYPQEITEIPRGVYAVKFGNKPGIMNYGIKPTISGKRSPMIEVHILDYDSNLYRQTISIEVLDKIRDEKKFDSLEDLKKQIDKDKEQCLKLLL